MPEAVNRARDLTAQALKYGLPLGRGTGPVNPYAPFARDLARPEVLAALQTAAARLEKEGIEPLIPEVMSNLGYATPYPEGPQDVAAFPGRLRRGPQGLLIPGPAGLRRLPPHRRGHPHRHDHPPGPQERHERQILRGPG